MVRLAGSSKRKPKVLPTIPQQNRGKANDLKANIQALGGNVEEDYELVRDANSDVAEDGITDPKLSGDVTNFMKSLNFGSLKKATGQDEEASTGSFSLEEVPERRTEVQERSSKGKLDARVAEVAAKLAESTMGSKAKFIFPPSPKWYLVLPPLPSVSSLPAASPEFLLSKSTLATSLISQEATIYAESSSHTTSNADARFLTRVLASGTLSDRLSALTLMVQGSPVHNMRAMDSLKAMASKKGREESLKALRAIVDWWVGGGAPDRKLKYFRDQLLTHRDVTNQHLVLWHFEDWLKKYFFAILQLMEGLSVDPLPYVRTQAMNLIFQLLRDKPEQEQNLLRLLVNKLGDSEKAVASKASHHLLQLLQVHPQMKKIIVHEVSALILRPPMTASSATASTQLPSEGNSHARYYAVITFNQIVLVPSDKDVAARLMDVYFELFKELLGEVVLVAEVQDPEKRDYTPKQRKGFKGKRGGEQKDRKGKGKAVDLGFHEVPDANSKLVSAILTGINRALPFVKIENSATFDKHINTLFRISHTATFNVSLQALTLIHHVSTNRQPIVARFYSALYASLLDPRLATSAKQAMYLNLLFKAVKSDHNHARVAAFVKRIVQVLGMHRPEFICGGLYLLGELFRSASDVRDMTKVGRNEVEPYDPKKRDPQYAHAESSCLWDLLPLLHHYHPSVALHARQILSQAQVTATADLGLNTLSHFLDRFVYRNPKKPRPKGASAMQPAAHDDGTGMVRAGKTADATHMVNAEAFRMKEEGDIPVDQVFFHRFFSRKHEKEHARTEKAEKRKGKRAARDGDDAAESDSDPEEEEIWKAMKESVPELGESDVNDDDSLGIPLSDDGDDEEADVEGDLEDGAESYSSGGSELDFIEDEDDIISVGGDPTNPMTYSSGTSEGEDNRDGEWQGFGSDQKTRKRGREKDADRAKKKRPKLATFASYEDYAPMIENSEENNV